jgi:hypothetical protein
VISYKFVEYLIQVFVYRDRCFQIKITMYPNKPKAGCFQETNRLDI